MPGATMKRVDFSQLFPLGKTVWTKGVNDLVAENAMFARFVLASLQRHAKADWGDLGAEDKASNDAALHQGDRILSAYKNPHGLPKIWIITEADRSSTTILFPDEY